MSAPSTVEELAAATAEVLRERGRSRGPTGADGSCCVLVAASVVRADYSLVTMLREAIVARVGEGVSRWNDDLATTDDDVYAVLALIAAGSSTAEQVTAG